MVMYKLGEVVRCTRESLYLSREELCEGICTVAHFSRLESGNRNLNQANYRTMMGRLGKFQHRCVPYIRTGDLVVFNRGKELEQMAVEGQFEELLAALPAFEARLDVTYGVNYQFVTWLKVKAEFHDQTIAHTDRELYVKRMRLVDALLCTLPSYEEGTLPDWIFSRTEILLFEEVAMTYAQQGDTVQAIALLQEIVAYLQTVKISRDERLRQEHSVLVKLARLLEEEGNMEEMVAVSRRGRDICMELGSARNLPVFLYDIALNQVREQEHQETQKQLLQAYYMAELAEDKEMMQRIKEYSPQLCGQTLR